MTRKKRGIWRRVLITWLVLLAFSQLWRRTHPFQPVPRQDERVVAVGTHVRIATIDTGVHDSRPPIVFIHGSPGDNSEVRAMALALAATHRVIAPDLPGFGASTRKVPCYSVRAHAAYVLQLLDSLQVAKAHVVGFSMGGGVAIEMAGIGPERVASLILLSGIGAQEYELLGDYLLNHSLHALQLGALWLLREGMPHFGRWDDGFMTVEYARNFYDTDQRPLRRILAGWQGPALIIQGDHDVLVPPAIATEHGRLVPQAEVELIPGDHFMAFARAGDMAARIGKFVGKVDAGTATVRATADPARVARAAEPWDPRTAPRPVGFSLAIVLFLLGAATLVSEDLACIAAGLLVGRGTIGFLSAVLACLIGIVVGDLLLYLAGRWIGRPALRMAPLKWFVSEADVARSSTWFESRGVWLVLASRFMPGTRLPTYVAAGMLHTRLLPFLGAFILASVLWVPLLVGAASVFGGQLLEWFSTTGRLAGPAFVAGLVLLYVLVRFAVSLVTWRGRRLLLSRWRRLTRWEFWPLWAFYAPVLLYILWLCIRYRSVTAFTRANPAIPLGGLVGESKYAI
ncbi:MAG TPA: alpha/beta fold hydrolase, partial [Gemmatimonadales bacterium]|nr:alpha/beta fold hydrolase [Gemmatimonadales bacterium]